MPHVTRWHQALVLAAVLLVGLNLRTAVASVSPLLSELQRSFDVPLWAIAALGALPPVCFAASGLLMPTAARVLGLERTMVFVLVALCIGLLGRAVSADAVQLLISSAVGFGAIGAGNVLLPPIVKKHFPLRYGLVTTVYVTAMAFSTFVPPLVSLPVADAWGWRGSLAVWGVFAFSALIPWLLIGRSSPDRRPIVPDPPTRVGSLVRSRTAWALTAIFAASGLTAYVSFGWMPQILQEQAGSSAAESAALLSLFAMLSLPAALGVPILADRLGAARAITVAAGLMLIAGYGGLLLWPAPFTWIWITFIGLGPMLFPLTLYQINARTRSPAMATRLSGFVQSIGYLVAALGPPAIGAIYSATRSWDAALIMMAISGIAVIAVANLVAGPHPLEDEVRDA